MPVSASAIGWGNATTIGDRATTGELSGNNAGSSARERASCTHVDESGIHTSGGSPNSSTSQPLTRRSVASAGGAPATVTSTHGRPDASSDSRNRAASVSRASVISGPVSTRSCRPSSQLTAAADAAVSSAASACCTLVPSSSANTTPSPMPPPTITASTAALGSTRVTLVTSRQL
jgi:hypothetical protein